MLKIRLKKLGRKKKACYRIVVIDSREKRDSKAIEEVGHYNPFTKECKINILKIKHRLKTGAQMTRTVQYLISNKQNINLQ